MSVRVCVHPRSAASAGVDSTGIHASRYGGASSSVGSVCMAPSTLLSASAVVAAITQHEVMNGPSFASSAAAASSSDSSSVARPAPSPKPSGRTGPGEGPGAAVRRPCALPEIPSSPSCRSSPAASTTITAAATAVSSALVLGVQSFGGGSSSSASSSSPEGASQCPSPRRSAFPNFRALQRLALSAKARATLKQDSLKQGAPGRQPSTSLPPYEHPARLSAQPSRSTGVMPTPAGFQALATLPGNRHSATDVLMTSGPLVDMHQAYQTDGSGPTRIRKKKSGKRRKRRSSRSSKSRGHRHPPQLRKPSPSENSLGSLLSAMPVAVETKKVEIYSSRYNRFDPETGRSLQQQVQPAAAGREEKLPAKAALSPPKPQQSGTATAIGSAVKRRTPLLVPAGPSTVIYASRVSPRIPAGVAGPGVAVAVRDREEGPRVTRVFLSDRQSGSLRECGLLLPCAPPGTPTPQMLQRYHYVPSMMDLRSQRAVRERLSGMEQKAKKKQQVQREESRRTEQQLQRDQAAASKQRQRLEIYALNKIMTDFEERNFLAFMTGKASGKAP